MNITVLPPDAIRSIYMFISLREALNIRSTCLVLNSDECDAFQYCCLYAHGKSAGNSSFSLRSFLKLVRTQDAVLARLSASNLGVLTAILRNRTTTSERLQRIFQFFLHNNEGSAVQLLLENGSIRVSIHDLESALRRNAKKVAAVLSKDERIAPHIQMCHECNEEMGCTWCDEKHECVLAGEFMSSRKQFCMPCMQSQGVTCSVCQHETCPACVRTLQETVLLTCRYCSASCCRNCRSRCFVCQRLACHVCQSAPKGPGRYQHYTDHGVIRVDWLCNDCTW